MIRVAIQHGKPAFFAADAYARRPRHLASAAIALAGGTGLTVRSAGELYRQYAAQRRYGIDIQNIGAEIKLRAERRAGELLSAMPKNSGQLFRGDLMLPRDDVPTYTELGLNKQQASRWQRASALPEDLFEQYLSETKERHEPLTSAAVFSLANALRRDASAAAPIDVRPKVAGAADLFRLIDAGATFGTIYVDPPYGAMPLRDLAALPVNDLAAEQAHLHLWAPSTYLFDAKTLLEAWGFTYRSTFVWVNPQPGEGIYWRESHTLLLLGVRGGAPFREAMRSWVEVPAEPGGGKPDIIREMIERVSPAPYLELFGQQAVPDWAVWHPETGYTLDHEQAPVPLQPSVATDQLCVKPELKSADTKRVGRTRKTPPRAAATDTLVPPSSSDFHLPPEMSFAKEMIAGGVAYVFRHGDLGLLGRIVVQDITGSQCLVSLEVAGDPEDPMTDRRLAVFEPVAKELVRRLELHSGRIESVLGMVPPAMPPDAGELVESKLMQCERCDAGVALLIFAPGATDPGRFEDYARRMYQQVVQMNVPTYVIGPALGDGPLMDRPADILKIWPEREAIQRLRPDEFNPLLDALARAHCADGSARQALERMYAADELPYRGTRRRRGNLCPKCFFYRRVSDADEGCDAYAKWLVDPPVKRENCEQFIRDEFRL